MCVKNSNLFEKYKIHDFAIYTQNLYYCLFNNSYKLFFCFIF